MLEREIKFNEINCLLMHHNDEYTTKSWHISIQFEKIESLPFVKKERKPVMKERFNFNVKRSQYILHGYKVII